MDNFLCAALIYFNNESSVCLDKGVATLPPLVGKKRDGRGESANVRCVSSQTEHSLARTRRKGKTVVVA